MQEKIYRPWLGKSFTTKTNYFLTQRVCTQISIIIESSQQPLSKLSLIEFWPTSLKLGGIVFIILLQLHNNLCHGHHGSHIPGNWGSKNLGDFVKDHKLRTSKSNIYIEFSLIYIMIIPAIPLGNRILLVLRESFKICGYNSLWKDNKLHVLPCLPVLHFPLSKMLRLEWDKWSTWASAKFKGVPKQNKTNKNKTRKSVYLILRLNLSPFLPLEKHA